ncbi:MAG TPA: pilus assembly protein [Rhizobiaceae bacterium]|mgnify:CR=1 FL=1|nr:pilus assembly protein [Rhizobiaceae bacterium]
MHEMNFGDTPIGRQPRRSGILRRFARDRKATTAIEFAFLVGPFLALMFAVIENALSFTVEQLVSNAADNAARTFRTGQADLSTMTKESFHDMLCADVKMIFTSCDNLIYTLKAYPTFADVADNIEWEGNDLKQTTSIFEPGDSTSKMSLQIYFKYPVRMDLVRMAISGTDWKLLYATTTWQNEPF